MTDVTTTDEGASAPSIFEQPVVSIGQARQQLRPPPRPREVSPTFLARALAAVIASEKPKLAEALERELEYLERTQVDNHTGTEQTARDTLEWFRDVRAMAAYSARR